LLFGKYHFCVLDLIGTAEIASLLDVTRQRVNQLVADDESFPSAIGELGNGRAWLRSDVEDWARESGRKMTKSRRSRRTMDDRFAASIELQHANQRWSRAYAQYQIDGDEEPFRRACDALNRASDRSRAAFS
jgi:predicted DNA-binding transcriptional regulator AlpA